MVVRGDPDNEPLYNDPRHDLSIPYRVGFTTQARFDRALTSVVLKGTTVFKKGAEHCLRERGSEMGVGLSDLAKL